MTIRIPGGADNPFNVGVARNDTTEMGLVGAPKSRYGLTSILQRDTARLADTVGRFQNEMDQTRYQDALNQMKMFENKVDNDPESGWRSLTGSRALEKVDGQSLDERVLQQYKDKWTALREPLAPRQRKAFDAYYEQFRFQKQLALNSHLVKQTKAHALETVNTSYTLGINDMASGDLDRMREGRAVAIACLGRTADVTGNPINVQEKLGGALLSGALSLTDDGKLDEARQWLEESREDMGEALYRKGAKALESADRSARAKAAAASIFAAHPENAAKGLRQAAGLPEDIRLKVGASLRQEYSLIREEKRAQENELRNIALGCVLENKDIPPSVWESLSPQSKLMVEGAQARRQKRGAAEEKRIEAQWRKDPIGTAIEQGRYGAREIVDWNVPGAEQEIENRVDMPAYEAVGGRLAPILSKGEIGRLTATMDAAQSQEQFETLARVNKAFQNVPEARERLMTQFIKGGRQTYATAFFLMGNDEVRAQSYLRGKEYIAQGRMKADYGMRVDSVKSEIYGILGSDGDGLGVTQDARALDFMVDAVLGVEADTMVSGSTMRSEEVVRKLFGGVGNRNGRKFFLPVVDGEPLDERSWFGDSFEQRLSNKKEAMNKSNRKLYLNGQIVSESTLALDLDNFQLVSVGNGQYMLVSDGHYVVNASGRDKGRPYVLDVLEAKK